MAKIESVAKIINFDTDQCRVIKVTVYTKGLKIMYLMN